MLRRAGRVVYSNVSLLLRLACMRYSLVGWPEAHKHVFVGSLVLEAMQLASSRDVAVRNEDMDVDAQRERDCCCGRIRRLLAKESETDMTRAAEAKVFTDNSKLRTIKK